MKEEISSARSKIENISPSKRSKFYETKMEERRNNKNDSGNDSEDSCIENNIETEILLTNVKNFADTKSAKNNDDDDNNNDNNNNNNNNTNDNNLRDQKTYLLKKMTNFNYPENFQQFSIAKKIEFFTNALKFEEEGCKNEFRFLPDDIIHLMVAANFDGDCGRSSDVRPEWLDMKKFKRGQKFAIDNTFGVAYAQLLSLFVLFSFEDGLKPLILTGKSSTPYTAFKRYISTGRRVRNWYREDPWKKGTAAYNDIQIVRKMHSVVRKKLFSTDKKTIDEKCKIENPYCPSRDILLEDFQSACSAPSLGQCPYMLYNNTEFHSIRPKGLNQCEMILTQFGFMGFIILYPEYFGVFNANEDDLEAFCHTWRGIGYLLGINDEFNFCRGTLNEVKERCDHFLKFWAIPNFRELTPECEHMMRCVIESLQYYIPGSYYENCVLYLSEMLNLHTPRLYSSLTYRMWFRHLFFKLLYQYICKVPGVLWLLNKKVNIALDNALNYSEEKHEELKKRSDETLKKYT